MVVEHVMVGGGSSGGERRKEEPKRQLITNADLAFSTIECSSLRRMDKALQNELAKQVGAWFDLASGPAELPNGSMPGFFVRKIMVREPLKMIQGRIGDENLETVDAQTLLRVMNEVLKDKAFLAVFNENLPKFRTDREDAAQKRRIEMAGSPSDRAGHELKQAIRSRLPEITPAPDSTKGKTGKQKGTA